MAEQAKQKIIPLDEDDCVKFVNEHREDIARGLCDVQIEKSWARALDPSDILLIAKHCPSSRPVVAAVTKAADLLETLAADPDGGVREAVADNPKTPVARLEALANDPVAAVRMAVAGNQNTPAAQLERLATDSVNYVRWSVANNEHTPAAALKNLAKDADSHVRDQAKSNPNMPKASLFARLIGRG
jgi:leucine rich repeat (LRR) protein